MEPLYRKVTADKHDEQVVGFTDNINTLIVGDSVMERLIWFAKVKFPENVLVLAKGGDIIQHLLWRLENTPNSDKITKIIVQIGQNNMFNKKVSAQAIADGIKKTVDLLSKKYPNASIFFIELYYQKNVEKFKTDEVNRITKSLIDKKFVDSFWTLILPNGYDNTKYDDEVHLNCDSYKKFYLMMLNLI